MDHRGPGQSALPAVGPASPGPRAYRLGSALLAARGPDGAHRPRVRPQPAPRSGVAPALLQPLLFCGSFGLVFGETWELSQWACGGDGPLPGRPRGGGSVSILRLQCGHPRLVLDAPARLGCGSSQVRRVGRAKEGFGETGLGWRWTQCSVSVSWAAAASQADTDLTRLGAPPLIPTLLSAGVTSCVVVGLRPEVGRGAPK